MNPEPERIAATVVAEIELRGLSYAIGGALAYGLWGIPCVMIDVDFDVFVAPTELDPLFDALSASGATVDRVALLRMADERGMVVVYIEGMRVDVFLPSIPFYADAERTRKLGPLHDRMAWFLSAEATCVFKLLFFRGKDIVDLERLVAVQGQRLDHAYVRRWMVEMMGESDERITRWDQLVHDFGR